MSGMRGVPHPRAWSPDARARDHAALASPARLRLLDVLAAAAQPMLIEELGEALALHASTLRGHLAVLRDAGLVTAEADHTTGTPGRPHLRYALTAHARNSAPGCRGNRGLADALCMFIDLDSSDPSASGEHAGQLWAEKVLPVRTVAGPGGCAALAEVAEELSTLGFAVSVDAGDDPVLRHRACAFGDVVGDHAQVACSIHTGLVDGLLERSGSQHQLAELTIHPEAGQCVARLRRRSVG